MATYNGARFIRQQLESILSQLSDGDEVIISDDGSTDQTLDIIHDFNSDRIKVFQNQGEHGYTPNFENALRHASGDYIFVSDQDDVWKPNKVSKCLDYLQDYDFIVTDAELIDARGNMTAPSFFALRHSRSGFIHNLIRFSFIGCCMAFKRDVLVRALPFPPNHRLCTHDNWLTLVGMGFYRGKAVDDKLIGYRRYGDNTSNGGMTDYTTIGFKLRYRLYLAFWLLRRFGASCLSLPKTDCDYHQ